MTYTFKVAKNADVTVLKSNKVVGMVPLAQILAAPAAFGALEMAREHVKNVVNAFHKSNQRRLLEKDLAQIDDALEMARTEIVIEQATAPVKKKAPIKRKSTNGKSAKQSVAASSKTGVDADSAPAGQQSPGVAVGGQDGN